MPEPPAGAHSALLCAMPSAGHVGPLLAVGEALRRRGWRVRMLTGARYLDQVAAAGIEPIALPPDADLLDALAAENRTGTGVGTPSTAVSSVPSSHLPLPRRVPSTRP